MSDPLLIFAWDGTEWKSRVSPNVTEILCPHAGIVPDFDQVKLSGDGRYLAATVVIGDECCRDISLVQQDVGASRRGGYIVWAIEYHFAIGIHYPFLVMGMSWR